MKVCGLIVLDWPAHSSDLCPCTIRLEELKTYFYKTTYSFKHFSATTAGPHKSKSLNLTVLRLDDTDEEHSYFGRKFLGVGTGGTLEIHGAKKLSWTFLNKTLQPGESNQRNYLFERSWGNRGIIVHVIDPNSGEVVGTDR